ncbi:MAG: hypothetical protein ACKO8T_07865 [Actinomycetota bacterium]
MTIGPLLFAAGLLAHQGGWDEILWVMVPIVLMVGLLRVATVRVRKNARAKPSDSGDVGAE